MKFIIDAQLPPGLCGWIEQRGHSALHVRHLSETPLSDVDIARWAAERSHIVLSKDEDFVGHCGRHRCGLVWLRCGNISKRALIGWLAGRWDHVETLLAAGNRFIELH